MRHPHAGVGHLVRRGSAACARPRPFGLQGLPYVLRVCLCERVQLGERSPVERGAGNAQGLVDVARSPVQVLQPERVRQVGGACGRPIVARLAGIGLLLVQKCQEPQQRGKEVLRLVRRSLGWQETLPLVKFRQPNAAWTLQQALASPVDGLVRQRAVRVRSAA